MSRDYGAIGACGDVGQPECCGTGDELPCDQIEVYEWHNVEVGDQIVVFDTTNPYENGGETRTVDAVGAADTDGLVVITLNQSLEKSYWRSDRYEPDPPSTDPYQPTFNNLQSAGIGVISDCDQDDNQVNGLGLCFFRADLRGVERPYADAFTEVFAPMKGMGALPHLGDAWFTWALDPDSPTFVFQSLSGTWFENLSGNYFHLIGANGDLLFDYHGITDRFVNMTYIFRGSNEIVGLLDGRSWAEIDNLTRTAVVHEVGHQFHTNPCATDDLGDPDPHDLRDSWCQAIGGECGPGAFVPQGCIMNQGVTDDDWDTTYRFCVEDLFLGDPTCDEPQPGEPRAGAIRTTEGPL